MEHDDIVKDLSLSLLSRGCGRLVSSDGNTGRRVGRLDICFTPQDYFIWKSQQSLLRLSTSGHLIVGAGPTLPKTYSTRRGVLLLYSQDLVTVETSCGSEARNRKRRVVFRQHAGKQQLTALKELTAAILSHRNTQSTSSRPAPPLFPPLRFPPVPDLPCPSPLPARPPRARPGPNPQRRPAEENAERPEDRPDDDEPSSGNRIRLDLFVPSTPRTPPPQTDPGPCVHCAAATPEEPEEPQHPDLNCDVTAVRRNSGATGEDVDHERSVSGNRRGRTGRFLPPVTVGRSVGRGPGLERTDGLRPGGSDAPRPPPAAEGRAEPAIPDRARPRAGRDGFHSCQRPLVLPPLLPEREEPPPVASSGGGAAGRKGPGKRSSLAPPQNRLLDLGADTGVVRGVLPLQLRDLQNGESVGCLILGPDGEIIRLSLHGDGRDRSGAAGATGASQQQTLQVLSPDGEELPWVIVLQPDGAGGVELNPDVPDVPVDDTQHHPPVHELSDLHGSTGTNPRSPARRAAAAAATQDESVETREIKKTEAENKPPEREPRGGDVEEEEEEAEEELSMTGQRSPVPSGSNRPGKKQRREDGGFRNPTEATREEAVDRGTKMTKRRDAEEAAGNRGANTAEAAESDGRKTSKTSRDGRQQRQKAGGGSRPIRSRKREEGTDREATETRDDSAQKKRRDGEGERGGEEANEEREGGGEAAEASAGKKRRRRKKWRPKDGESSVGNPGPPQEQEEEEEVDRERDQESPSATQEHDNKTKTKSAEDMDRRSVSTGDRHGGVRSPSSLRSTNTSSWVGHRSSRRSDVSSREGPTPASAAAGLASARGRLSSCSTVMVPDEQLMLNPVKPESSTAGQSQQELEELEEEEEKAAVLHLAQRAERRRQEVERKRREREEEERRQRQEREQTEQRMRSELEEERRKRAEQLRLRKTAEEEDRRRREEEEQERARREQERRERERRRQEEKRRQMERLQRMREEEEERRRAALERLRLEEQKRQQEEEEKLREMDEDERREYLHRKEEEEKERMRREEEAAEEARLQAKLLDREVALLQRQLVFKRGLALEAGGLDKTQGISRPWIYSYFALFQLLGLKSA